MNLIVVKKRNTRITSSFSPLVNQKVPSKIRNLVNIVQILEKNKINLTYSMTVRVLLLIFWNTLPGSSRFKVILIMTAKFIEVLGYKAEMFLFRK